MKLRVGDIVSNVRIIAEQDKNYGVVTYVPEHGDKVEVCWNGWGRHYPIHLQTLTSELPEYLILESMVDTSERKPEWEKVDSRHYRSKWFMDGEESTVEMFQVGQELEWIVRRNGKLVYYEVLGEAGKAQKWVEGVYKQMGYKQI